MKRVALLSLILVNLAAPALAHGDIIEKIEAHYGASSGIQADFTQTTHIEIMERDDVKSGTLYFSKNKFRINYQKPEKQEFIYDGDTLWIYTPRYKEVEVYSSATDQISREALAFLSGLGEMRQSFRIPQVKSSGEDYVLTLIPKSDDSQFKKIVLTFAQNSYAIQSAELWPKQGNVSQYRFAHLNSNADLKAKLFEFKTPRGVSERHPEF